MRKFLLIIVVLAFCSNAKASTTWYVSKSGSDSNNGKSEAASFLTIQKAVNTSVSGDIIIVDDGQYSESSSSSSRVVISKKITIKSKNGPENTIITGAYGVSCVKGTNENKSNYPTIEGFTLQKGNAMYGGGAENVNLVRCKIVGCSSSAPTSGSALGSGVYRCVVHNSVFYGNSVYSTSSGVVAYSYLYNCTLYENIGSNKTVTGGEGAMYNCIVFGNNARNYVGYNWGFYAYNCYLDDNPGVKDASSADFQLTKASPCVDSGKNSYVSTSEDYAGYQRISQGVVDIGAYEYQPPEFSVNITNTRQRYPWNGKIDFTLTIGGEESSSGIVKFSAVDVIGGTNLPMKTISRISGASVNVSGETMAPGVYNLVWDAAKDLPNDYKCDRVKIKVEIE